MMPDRADGLDAMCALSAEDRLLLWELAALLAHHNGALRDMLRSHIHIMRDAVEGQEHLPLRAPGLRLVSREGGEGTPP